MMRELSFKRTLRMLNLLILILMTARNLKVSFHKLFVCFIFLKRWFCWLHILLCSPNGLLNTVRQIVQMISDEAWFGWSNSIALI